jgi:hypothetical protein
LPCPPVHGNPYPSYVLFHLDKCPYLICFYYIARYWGIGYGTFKAWQWLGFFFIQFATVEWLMPNTRAIARWELRSRNDLSTASLSTWAVFLTLCKTEKLLHELHL